MKLVHSFPSLTENLISKLNTILSQEFGYNSIPDDYKSFLLKNNGGYVLPGYIEDTEITQHQKEVVFETPLRWAKDNNKPVRPCLVAFFVVWLEDDMDENEVEDWEMAELVASNEHSKLDFDILPNNMMSIAKCSHPDCADMLCISLDKKEYGSVYYNYGLCDHPANFHGDFYNDRIETIFKQYNITSYEEIDEETIEGQIIIDQIKSAYFVKVGNSFSEFLENCKIIEVEREI
ncbi:SMI1/KNR4 family protein [Bernardetia sp. Wsw4-3y2]|uniref:SMI1/KNR4 family protein n=1 Tax=Bernardetia sp. Wsw4-3y2 TaxID=3127471 RepID=UPI0030CE8B95